MKKSSWMRWALVALLVVLATSAGFSRALRMRRIHRYLDARLEASFGRPVEVHHYSFSLLDGLRFEADSISVAEDPRFGYEYFLRAERLTAGLRWGALARGRFEFGTLSFIRPSLNLVRAADGRWNIESWLPPSATAAQGSAPGQPSADPSGRLYRIEVDSGRINFKRGVDKHPFALVEVSGHLEQESAGRWLVNLEARPSRAAVSLQEGGVLRVRGRVAGTSARLQPAQLALSWQEASLADALRLARGRDYGVRGRLAIELTARSEAPGATPAGSSASDDEESPARSGATLEEARGTRWSFAGSARLENLHRWDLPHRPGDPAVNLRAQGEWRTSEPRVAFTEWVLDAPRSSVHGTGRVVWGPARDSEWQLASSGIAWGDLLAWYRAFRPGVAEGVALDGYAGIDFSLRGWPLRLERGVLASTGIRLHVAGFREPVRVARITARVHRGRLELDPVAIVLPAAGPETTSPEQQTGMLRVEGAIGPAEGFARPWQFELNLAGQTDRAQDLLTAAQALGRTLNHGWSAEGPVVLDLGWQGTVRPFAVAPAGSIELRGFRLRLPYLNRPLSFPNARIDLRGGERRITLVGAQAFGARWTGSLWKNPQRPAGRGAAWEFDLSADRLDVMELDRWLGPRARPAGLLERFLPSGAANRSSAALDALLDRLHARGTLRVDQFVLAPLAASRLRAAAEVDGRNLDFRIAPADFYGGRLGGSLRAELLPEPVYSILAQFQDINLTLLTDATPLKNRFFGDASGILKLSAHGVGRGNLLSSLEGDGAIEIHNAEMRGLDLDATSQAAAFRPGITHFRLAAGQFSLAGSQVHIQKLALASHTDIYEVGGDVDFSRTLDLRLAWLGHGTRRAPSRASSQIFASPAAKLMLHIAGPLDALQVTRIEPAAATQH